MYSVTIYNSYSLTNICFFSSETYLAFDFSTKSTYFDKYLPKYKNITKKSTLFVVEILWYSIFLIFSKFFNSNEKLIYIFTDFSGSDDVLCL